MRITKLTIEPTKNWAAPGPTNPMRCVVKIDSDKTCVETILADAQVQQILDLIVGIVATAAEKNVSDFVSLARSVDASNLALIAE